MRALTPKQAYEVAEIVFLEIQGVLTEVEDLLPQDASKEDIFNLLHKILKQKAQEARSEANARRD